MPVSYGRYLAEHIPGARMVELDGDAHAPQWGEVETVLSLSEEFLTGHSSTSKQAERVLATFDAPARGLQCADTLRSTLSDAGIAIRAGAHTGEVELRGDDVSGIGVHIAARVAALAGSGELLASRTVEDLLAGSNYSFASRGMHSLKGVPDEWELLAVA